MSPDQILKIFNAVFLTKTTHAKEFFPKPVLEPVLEIWNFSAKCFVFASKV